MGTRASSGRSRRHAHPRLQAYIDRVWLPEDRSDIPVSVTLDTAPPDYVVAEEYAVLPSAGCPRYLVPLHTRAASVAGFRTYNAARSPVSRLARRAVAAGFDTGVAPRLLRDRLVVSVHASCRGNGGARCCWSNTLPTYWASPS